MHNIRFRFISIHFISNVTLFEAYKNNIDEYVLPGGWGAGTGVSGATVVPGLLLPQDTAFSGRDYDKI